MRRAAGYTANDSRHEGPPLPNLPGHAPMHLTVPKNKGQTLRYRNGYPIVEDLDDAGSGDPLNRTYVWGDGKVHDHVPAPPPFALHVGAEIPPRKEAAIFQPTSAASTSSTSKNIPNWLAYDRKILRFRGYFREDVPNSPIETWRVRNCTFRYFLESDQLEVTEEREPNSGLPQGVLLHKHRAVTVGGRPLHWRDLRIGQPLVLYKRQYALCACDPFTRDFYLHHGEEQPPNMPLPEGPIDTKRKEVDAQRRVATAAVAAAHANPSESDAPIYSPRGANAVFELFPARRAQDYLDGIVLRFLCAWDNTASTFGEVLCFALFFYVGDGSVEIREVHRRNSGRDPFPLLLHRMKLPKTTPPVFGRPLSPRSRRALQLEYYTWQELRLGATLNVYGRKLLIYDCDDNTRLWYRQHLGLSDEQLTPIPVEFDLGPKRPPLRIPPNVGGFGSEEDTLQNVLHLIPKRPLKALPDDPQPAGSGSVLRFSARMAPLGAGGELVGPYDAERRFILSFFLRDKTIGIWEPKRANSGMEGGVFLEHTRVRNPHTGQPYEESDMQVGSVLAVFGRGFELLDADAFTLRYMEREYARFPWADYHKVLDKLLLTLQHYSATLPEQLRVALLEADVHGTGYVDKRTLHSVLRRLGFDLSLHEVITLVRQLGADRQGLLLEQLFRAMGLMGSGAAGEELPPPPPREQTQQQRFGEPGESSSSSTSTSTASEHQPQALWEARGQQAGWEQWQQQQHNSNTEELSFKELPLQMQEMKQEAQLAEAAAAAAVPRRRVAWALPPSTQAAEALTTGLVPYRGIGPTPAHPRIVDPRFPLTLTGGMQQTQTAVQGQQPRPWSAQSQTLSEAPAPGPRAVVMPPAQPTAPQPKYPFHPQHTSTPPWAGAYTGTGTAGSDVYLQRDTPEKAPRDPRFIVPPGAIGYGAGGGSRPVTSGSAVAELEAKAAALQLQREGGAGAGSARPRSLWMTTNMAPGGVNNPMSFRRY